MEIEIPENLESEMEYTVEKEDLASFLGSGNVHVLSTPSMINWMETTSRIELDKHLPEGYTTVGYRIDVYHTNPAPLGAKVRIKIKLLKQEKRKLTLEVSAWWNDIKIGEGKHERFIINIEKFRRKIEEKLKHLGDK